MPDGLTTIRGLRELHAGDEGVGDGDFFGEGDDRGFHGEVLEAVAGAVLEDEVAEGEEFIFVLGVAATGNEVGEDYDVIGEIVVSVAVFPDSELDVDVASEVAEGCANAVPVKDCIIVAGTVALGKVDAKVVEQIFDAVSCYCREGFVGVGCHVDGGRGWCDCLFRFLETEGETREFFEEFHILKNFIVRHFYHRDLDSGVQLSDGRK